MMLGEAHAQKLRMDSVWQESRKNVVRYNLSAAALFGFDKAVILGYERVINPHQTISVNFGKTALPKLINIDTDSFSVSKDVKNTGFNFSLDYRFYLRKENRDYAPHGLYLGPYYAFTQLKRETNWTGKQGSGDNQEATVTADWNWNVVGVEMGYQFVFAKRITLDFVLVGPGVAWYDLKAKAEGQLLTDEDREQLLDAAIQLIEEKFPGFNYVLSGEELNASGRLTTTSVGFRYLIQVGFLF
jgi:hypothetical protein